MYTVEVEIEGIVPMKQNRVSDSYGQNPKSVIVTKEMEEKAFHKKAYRDKGGFFIPALQLNSAVINGLSIPKPFVSNKVKLHKKTVKACIFVTEKAYLYNSKQEIKYEKDTCFVPTKTGLAISIRPMFMEGWKVKFRVVCVQDWLVPEVLEEGIKRAGICHGLGSHRPLFGRFIVKSFKVVESSE